MSYVRTPEVNLYFLSPTISVTGDVSEWVAQPITFEGENVGASKFLVSLKYSYETGDADTCDITLNFKSTDLNLTLFREGVKLAVSWGYRGEKFISREVIIEKVKGTYNTSGYTLTLKCIPTVTWASMADLGEDLEGAITSGGFNITYRYVNPKTGDLVTMVYYPKTSAWAVSGAVKDRTPPPVEAKIPYSVWYAKGGADSPDVPVWLRQQPPTPERPTNQLLFLKEKIKDQLIRLMMANSLPANVTERDDSLMVEGDISTRPMVGVFSVTGTEKSIPRCINFQFNAGDVDPLEESERDAEIELFTLDPEWKTGKGIKITGEWKVLDPTNPGRKETLKIIEKDGAYYYDLGDDKTVEIKLEEVLRLKKLKLRRNYNEYKRDLTDNVQDITQSPETKMMRNAAAEKDAAFLTDQIFQGNVSKEPWLNETPSQNLTRNYVKRVSVSGNANELINKAVKRKLDAIYNNLTCEFSLEGEPALESSFNFGILNAGYGVSGKYTCDKTVHHIVAGKYTTTIHGVKIPEEVKLTVDAAVQKLDEFIRTLEKSHNVFEKMEIITSIALGPDGKGFGTSLNPPSTVGLMLEKNWGLNVNTWDLNYSRNKYKLQEGTKDQEISHRLIASSEEEFIRFTKDKAKVAEMKNFEISLTNRRERLYKIEDPGIFYDPFEMSSIPTEHGKSLFIYPMKTTIPSRMDEILTPIDPNE